jgi:hypothetical protein
VPRERRFEPFGRGIYSPRFSERTYKALLERARAQLELDREQALVALQKSCRQRVEYLAIPLEGSPLPLPTPVPVTVGGATVFVLPVERFEEF